MQQNLKADRYDFVVLNSLSFFESARTFMEDHGRILLYLDRDKAGQNCSRYALSLSSKYKDHSGLYRLHKDLNDWVMNFGKVGHGAFQEPEHLKDDLTDRISNQP